jgi:hypothetical protein
VKVRGERHTAHSKSMSSISISINFNISTIMIISITLLRRHTARLSMMLYCNTIGSIISSDNDYQVKSSYMIRRVTASHENAVTSLGVKT